MMDKNINKLKTFPVKEQHETPKKQEIVIDESGFITSPDLWLEEKPEENEQRKQRARPLPVENKHGILSGEFQLPVEILLPAKKPRKNSNSFVRIPVVKQEPLDNWDKAKKRINPFYKVNCPFCNREFIYRVLFDHISTKHPEHNPKLALAAINRKFRGER
jgi:hypothetical protein